MQHKPDQSTSEQWRKDPNNWKLGVFYFNKQDKRIFPPKRFKYMGWTVNFANPYSVLALVVLIILIGVVADYFKQLK